MSKGWVQVICGPMYSGKTEALLRYMRRFDIIGKRTALFKPETDTRTILVTSRSGVTYPAISVKDSMELFYESQYHMYEVVAIDEAQFFDRGLLRRVRELAQAGTHVIVSGLDRDFLQRPFGPMGDLLMEADEVTKLTAVCFKCKGDATLTQRIVDGHPATVDDPLIVVGGMGDDVYEARCRNCWELG